MTKKAKILSIIFLGACFLGFLVLALPPTCNLIINLVEQLMGRELRDPGRWIEIIQHCATIAMCVIALVGFLGFTCRGKLFAREICQVGMPFFQFVVTRRFFVLLVGAFACYFLCFYKIISADFYYADDLWRSYDGSRSWIGFSRYVSEFLSIVLHTNFYLSDIAPLTQFLAIAVMGFSTILLAWLVTGGQITMLSMAICSLLFLSPFNAQNLSYRFDSTYIALSALFPLVPFLFRKDGKVFVFVSIICLILCCMSYQSGTSIYIVMAIFFATSMWLEKDSYRKIFTFVGLAVASFAFALIMFKLLFMNTLEDISNLYYSTSFSLEVIPRNISTYLQTTSRLFGGLWIKLFLGISLIVAFVQGIKASRQNKIATCLFLLGMAVLAYILSFGPYLIFARTLFAPRALTGFSMLVTLVGISIYKNTLLLWKDKKPWGGFVPVLCLLYGCVVFQFAYGVALAEQRQYQDFRTDILIADLAKYAKSTEKSYVSFSGSIGLSEGMQVNVETFPLIAELMTVVPSGGGIWNDDLLTSYNFNCEDEYLSENPGWPLLTSSRYHDIYGEGNHFFVVLRH